MEAREYRTKDKSNWTDGPWKDEPDKMQWSDADTGFPCLIVRGPAGALCGYVGVADGHPAFGRDYSADPLYDIEVHGGLTYADKCQEVDDESHGICHLPGDGEPDHVWWLGFDCAHSWDFAPKPKEYLVGAYGDTHESEGYRDVRYVQNECANLARQLREVENQCKTGKSSAASESV